MDNSEHEQSDNGGGTSLEFPQSQELFSDSEPADEREVAVITHDTSSSDQDDDSLFQAQITCTPTRTRRTRREGGRSIFPPALHVSSDSSDCESPLKKLNLKDIFENHFRKKRKRKRKHLIRKRYLATRKKPQQATERKPRYSVPLAHRRRRLLHQGIRFPFTSFKYLPFKLYFAYEQSVLGGFLNHIKNMKYDRHLQNSLKNMDAGEDLEDGKFETRKYTYLDDDGPLSPISEPGDNVNCDEDTMEDYDAKVVENHSFILDCRVPSKDNWQIKGKKKKKVRSK